MSTEQSTWVALSQQNIELVSALDLRAEAESAISKGEPAWLFASKSCSVVYFPRTGEAGIARGANTVWGASRVCGENGAFSRFRLDIGGETEIRLMDERGVGRCCYTDCDGETALEWVDGDGDWCCEEHHAKHASYVEIAREEPNALTDARLARKYVEIMADLGWTVEVSRGTGREAEGTHIRNNDGTLRALNSASGSLSESYRLDSERAYNKVCAG